MSAHHFKGFDYTALGHLHRAHTVLNDSIRYSGSLLKYSLSEENHVKGFYVIDLDGEGNTEVKKEIFIPKRDLRSVTGTMDEIYRHQRSEDYVFINLLDETPVLSPMEKVRSVYPNAMHVTRQAALNYTLSPNTTVEEQAQLTPIEKYELFFKEVKGAELTTEQKEIMYEVMDDLLLDEREVTKEVDR